MIRSKSGIIRPSLNEIVAMPKEEGHRWMNHILCEATMRAMKLQSELRAQREFNQLERTRTAPDWCQVIISREKSNDEEHWLLFTKDDGIAKFHPSYTYFQEALESGLTVLASTRSMGWNCLENTDQILHMVYSSDLTLTKYDMLTRGKKLAKYGI